MAKSPGKAALLSAMKDASDVFRHCSRKIKILSVLSWNGAVADEFFKYKEDKLPTPIYPVDRANLNDMIERLDKLAPKLKGEHPVLAWLAKTRESYLDACKLLLATETKFFYEVSSKLYGNANSHPIKAGVSNLGLAQSISQRMAVCELNDISESRIFEDADTFAADVQAKIKVRIPAIPVKVEITDDIAAKVVAGMNRVRIRKNTRFAKLEVSALWNHELETHCLTANNGLLQENADFLSSGGPRTTMTQEGLAVFFEMYGHSMSQRRFLALCDRTLAIDMAEKGADFMQIYRWYKERSESEMEAFFAASRIFRGSPLKGGAPFTKDVVYLGGLLAVFNFLQLAVKNQNRLLVESLICGRIALEDVGTIAWLRTHGLLSPPKYTPTWLENWEALLSFFSFSAFVNSVDLSSVQDYFDANNTLQTWDFGF